MPNDFEVEAGAEDDNFSADADWDEVGEYDLPDSVGLFDND